MTLTMATPDPMDGKKEACKTFVEQTKLLVTLASAFLVVPVGLVAFFTDKTTPAMGIASLWELLLAEGCFVASVLMGYVVLGTIAGSQDGGSFDVYRRATRNFSFAQIGAYLGGMGLFVALAITVFRASASTRPAATGAADDSVVYLVHAPIEEKQGTVLSTFWFDLASGTPTNLKGVSMGTDQSGRVRKLVATLKACVGNTPGQDVVVHVAGFADVNEFVNGPPGMNLEVAHRRARAAFEFLQQFVGSQVGEPRLKVLEPVQWRSEAEMESSARYFAGRPLKETGAQRDEGQLNRRVDVILDSAGVCTVLGRK
jgi:hypothetical protein